MDILSNKKKSTSPKTSRELKLKEMEFKMTEANFENENYFQICCFEKRTDKRLIIFCSQFIIGLIIITFCLFKLYGDLDCGDDSKYIGLLTMIIGIFLPNPKITKK